MSFRLAPHLATLRLCWPTCSESACLRMKATRHPAVRRSRRATVEIYQNQTSADDAAKIGGAEMQESTIDQWQSR